MTKKRDVRDDERDLWNEVTRHMHRLRGRKAAADAPAEATKAQAKKAEPKKSRVASPALPSPAPSPPAAKPMPRGAGIDGSTAERLRRGKVEPDARVDLHGMTQAQAHTRLFSFVKRCADQGDRCLLVITGKGSPGDKRDETAPFVMPERPKAGVLRTLVPRWLQEDEMRVYVVGVQAAHVKHGGAGALYVYLRRRRTRS